MPVCTTTSAHDAVNKVVDVAVFMQRLQCAAWFLASPCRVMVDVSLLMVLFMA